MMTLATLTVVRPARALEGNSPFLRGITIGVPIGALPPPGTYFSTFAAQFAFEAYDAKGRSTSSRLDETLAGVELLYVPDIPKIFGATYGLAVGQPIEYNNFRMPSGSMEQFGIVNTIIEPIALSWKLPNNFSFGTDLTVYPPNGTYNVRNAASVSRHYATIEPSVALSYVSEQWQATIHPVLDVNWTNPADRYRSGTVIVMDYSGLFKRDRFAAGLGGTLTYQLTDDTIAGRPVAAVPGQHGPGNRAEDFSIGPVVSYQVADVTLKGYATQSLRTRNTAGGTSYFLTVALPLNSSPAPFASESAGPR